MYSKVYWIAWLPVFLFESGRGFWQKGIRQPQSSFVCLYSQQKLYLYLYLNRRWSLFESGRGFWQKGSSHSHHHPSSGLLPPLLPLLPDSTEYRHWHHHHHHQHHHHYHCCQQPHRHIQLHWNHIYHHHQPSSWLVSKMFTFVDLFVYKGVLMSINLRVVCICSWSCICICIWTGGGRWAWMNWPTDKGWPTANSFHKLSTRGPPCIWFLHFDIFDLAQIINWIIII